MNEKLPISLNERRFKLFVLISIAVLAGAVLWLSHRLDLLSDKQRNLSSTLVQKTTSTNPQNSGWNTTLKSGKNGFEMTVPDGWGPLTRDTTGDFFIMPGTAQPTVVSGKKVTVFDTKGYGSDNASVFLAALSGTEFAPPRGSAEDFTIGKGEDALSGKKYTYIYSKDEIVGIGYQRFQGDRDYEYVFPAGNKELHINYSVYGSDPRNLSATVDEIVRSIRLL